MSIRSISFLLLFFSASHSLCQEKPALRSRNKIVNKPEDPATVIVKTVETLKKIQNAEYIWKEASTIPYLPAVFNEPFIARAVVSMNMADTIQGASLKFYLLEDTFRLRTVYDGRYIARVDESGKAYIGDLNRDPFIARGMIGSFHLRIKTWLENAIKRNAEIKITEANDSLKIEMAFNNQQIEFGTKGILSVKDTLGFVSRYTVYIDRHTYLPVKAMRQMPYQTSIETILYQEINAADTIAIDVHDAVKQDSLREYLSFIPDHSLERRLKDTRVWNWKLKEVEGDSVWFSDIRGRKCLMVFNSVGWKPCVQAIPFLKQLKNEYPAASLELVSIEPFITSAGVLKDYKRKHEMNYPLLLADAAIKTHFTVSQVPVFMIIDKHGIIRKIITGFYGKDTETEVRRAIEQF
jgi:hypothetical protein